MSIKYSKLSTLTDLKDGANAENYLKQLYDLAGRENYAELATRFIENVEDYAEGTNVIVAIENNKIIGACLISDLDYYDFGVTKYADMRKCASYIIDGILVDSKYRGKNIGTKLLKTAVTDLLKRDSAYIGNKQVYLFADVYEQSVAFYTANKFKAEKLPEETLYVKKVK